MNIEPLSRTSQVNLDMLAPSCLQETYPRKCDVVTGHGESVPLGSAGYVISMGHTYRLRLELPFPREEVERVRLVNMPEFLKGEEGYSEPSGDGQWVWFIPFSCVGDFKSRLSKFGVKILSGELDVQIYFKDGIKRPAPRIKLPLVVVTRWTTIFFTLLGTIFVIVAERLVSDAFVIEKDTPGGWKNYLGRMFSIDWTYGVSVFVGILIILRVTHRIILYRRANQLRNHYERRYGMPVAKKMN